MAILEGEEWCWRHPAHGIEKLLERARGRIKDGREGCISVKGGSRCKGREPSVKLRRWLYKVVLALPPPPAGRSDHTCILFWGGAWCPRCAGHVVLCCVCCPTQHPRQLCVCCCVIEAPLLCITEHLIC